MWRRGSDSSAILFFTVRCFLSSFLFRPTFYCLFTTHCRPSSFVLLFTPPDITVLVDCSGFDPSYSYFLVFIYCFLSSFPFRSALLLFVYYFMSSFPFRPTVYCLFTTLCRPFLFVPLFTVCLLLSVVLSFSSHCLLFVYYFLSSFSFRSAFYCLFTTFCCPFLFVLPFTVCLRLSPRRDAGNVCWKPLSGISGLSFDSSFLSPLLFFLPSPLTLSVLSLSANGPFSWLFFLQKILKPVSLRDRLFCMALVVSLSTHIDDKDYISWDPVRLTGC